MRAEDLQQLDPCGAAQDAKFGPGHCAEQFGSHRTCGLYSHIDDMRALPRRT
jgi:hypothetical protein